MAKAFKIGKAYMKGELMKKNANLDEDCGPDDPPGKLSLFNFICSQEVCLGSNSYSTYVLAQAISVINGSSKF